ncbi:MAG: family 16 glycosylhydrolase [Ignavibacteriales bacterium]|nr:family 16 glycosylhydrolase [Ignavibacteriales bacterium]
MKNTKYFSLLIFFLVILSINVRAKSYKGAEYRTKESFLYGRFEASIKSAGKEGMTTTMFTYFDGLPGDDWSSSKWNEIDIEIMGRYNNDVQYNTITPGQANHVRHQYVNFDPALDYHTYAFEWTPDYVAWFIDGVEVYRQTAEHIKTLSRAQKFMFNIWNPQWATWAGVWNDAILPAFGFYDWTAYYEYKPGEGDYGTNNNFKLSWKDDFDFFDDTRWEKATHTFGGNMCDFLPDNIVFENGKMILCLTNSSNTGYADNSAPAIITARTFSTDKILAFFSEQVDKVSAENKSNYLLTSGQITSARLLADNRTVELTTNSSTFNDVLRIIVKGGVKDLFKTPNTSPIQSWAVKITKEFSFPLKINVGGKAYSDFIADREFVTDTSEYGYMEKNSIDETNEPVSGTDDDAVYQNCVTGLAKYLVRVPKGKYSVKLLFSENYFTQTGKRVFDIYTQGNLVVDNLDVFQRVGKYSALEIELPAVEVYSGLLDIHFAAEIDRPILSGIIIEYAGATDVEEKESLNLDFHLQQNYPNPFNPSTTIEYVIPNVETGYIPSPRHVTLKIYDIVGREITTLVDEYQQSGKHNVEFRMQNAELSSGIYFYQLTAGSFSQTRKMLLLK